MARTDTHHASIDDYLGSAQHRFFGSGYRRVNQQLDGVRAEFGSNGTGTIRAEARIAYPADWSTKSALNELRPHLSTLDGTVLSVLLAETYLTAALGLSDEQRRAMWLRRLVMRAGAAPEEDLDRIHVSAAHLGSADESVGTVSAFDCRIGAMRVRLEVVHSSGRAQPEGFLRVPEGFLGPLEDRYYCGGYRSRDHAIRAVQLDLEALRVRADVEVHGPPEQPPGQGFGGLYEPALSMLDCMVVVPQLAQSLLYRIDGIERERSNTLWMRQVTMEAPTPRQPLDGVLAADTSIVRSRVLDYAGGRWRTSDWSGTFQQLTFRYSLAHRLPDGVGKGSNGSAGGAGRAE
jgi:hypothetical protein